MLRSTSVLGSRIMADTTEKDAKISIKVIVDKVRKRVVYAEADHTFVDILFSFITLPMGTIVRLLGKLDDTRFEALKSLSNLYQILKDFPQCYLAREHCKFMLLNPRSMAYNHCRSLKLKIDDTEPMKSFASKHPMFSSVFVSDIATFIITDDLCVEPFTSANSIRLLTDLGITNMDHLEERNLEFSSDQMLHFLNMALSTNCPLTCLVFSTIQPIRHFVRFEQANTSDQCDLMRTELSSSSKMLLEVSLQKSTGKLLFAEAKDDFVEFLFSILSIPLGTVVGTLMNGASSLSCMDNIFKSISNMSVGSYLKSEVIKVMLLKPHIGQLHPSKNQVFSLPGVPTHLCGYQHTDPRIDGRLLKQCGLFMVTDDLIITPSSTLSTLGILNKMKVLPEDIERYEVSISFKEALSMLKASLRSCSTLSTSLEHQLKK